MTDLVWRCKRHPSTYIVVHEMVIANLMLVVSYQSSYGAGVGLTESVVELRGPGVKPNVLILWSKPRTLGRNLGLARGWSAFAKLRALKWRALRQQRNSG